MRLLGQALSVMQLMHQPRKLLKEVQSTLEGVCDFTTTQNLFVIEYVQNCFAHGL